MRLEHGSGLGGWQRVAEAVAAGPWTTQAPDPLGNRDDIDEGLVQLVYCTNLAGKLPTAAFRQEPLGWWAIWRGGVCACD